MKERRILIIEDNSDDAELLLRQLKKAELERRVQTIRDGRKALDYLKDPARKAEELAAVFLDLKLPKVDGMQILEEIRADERLKGLSVVVMTSCISPEELERCSELGISCFVQKPLTFSSFAKAFADTFSASREVTV